MYLLMLLAFLLQGCGVEEIAPLRQDQQGQALTAEIEPVLAAKSGYMVGGEDFRAKDHEALPEKVRVLILDENKNGRRGLR